MHSFDIDNYLNYLIPRPRWHLLPRPVSFWFGYRKSPSSPASASGPTSVLLVWLFSFLGAFIGISIIENVFRNLPRLGGHQAPLVIASFGAAAILEYNAIESPLSQPRNLILGHFLSAVIGVGITKLFQLLPEAQFEDLRWLAGALSVGAVSAAMSFTKTVHPPAGATALLAATNSDVTILGWWLVPLVLLASSLMLASAMLVNNLYKRFPLYWWTPVDLSKARFGKDDGEIVTVGDVEKGIAESESSFSLHSVSDVGLEKNAAPPPAALAKTRSDAHTNSDERSHYDTIEKKRLRNIHDDQELKIQIEADRIIVPDWMNLSQWEVEVLEGFQKKLRDAVKTIE